ncbi:hypothetical protein [Staphylococcus epidermidis]|uniref:hypothetical protein n=1 Tax=Staphylococcus epidermidis TaxID=1282 RepID=UPI0023F886E4|nr:hypothetical protein [Staphylococcus epidermidis]
MGKYEDLMIKYDHLPITETKYMPDFMSGLYLDGEIFNLLMIIRVLDKNLKL